MSTIIEPKHTRTFDVISTAGRNTIITVDTGKVSATLLKNGSPVGELIIIAAGQTGTLQIPDDSSGNDKYTVKITGEDNISSEYNIGGNAIAVE